MPDWGEYEDPSDVEELADYLSDEDEYDGDPPGYDAPALDESWDCVVTVDNLPVVPKAKESKLQGVLNKIFGQMGEVTLLKMPFSKEGSSLGFCFVEFRSPEMAAKAVKLTNGYALDKAHVFKVEPYSALVKIASMPDTYKEPEKKAFEERVNINEWLTDADHRDQFVVRHGEETEVFWSMGMQVTNPILSYGGEREKKTGLNWCEMYVTWSSQGSYLATFHRKGIAVWGGQAFEKIGRYAHPGVKAAEFSPGESYIITCNFIEGDPRAIIVWDVRSSRELRSFPLTINPETSAPHQFKWSFDDSFIARLGKDKAGTGDVITVYELPSMGLLDKKSLRADGAREFHWSPAANSLAYWAPEMGNAPARVTLVSLPSRDELRQKNLFHVSDCKIHWQADGEYLCVKVLRHTKSKKTLFNNFELFRVNAKMIPVESLEIKEQVTAFAWEPRGDRFAIVHGEGGRPNVSIYTMDGDTGRGGGRECALVRTLESRACNSLYWSPQGGHLLLTTLGETSGALEFHDVDHGTSKHEEHYRMTHVEWDPSGRTLCTAVCQPLEGAFFKFQMDNGFKVWTFQGELVYEESREAFYQFSWRPRPKSLLTDHQRKAVVKNLRKYERVFERADRRKQYARDYAATSAKRALRKAFREQLAAMNAAAKRSRALALRAARGGYDEDDDANFEVTTSVVEQMINVTQEDVANKV